MLRARTGSAGEVLALIEMMFESFRADCRGWPRWRAYRIVGVVFTVEVRTRCTGGGSDGIQRVFWAEAVRAFGARAAESGGLGERSRAWCAGARASGHH